MWQVSDVISQGHRQDCRIHKLRLPHVNSEILSTYASLVSVGAMRFMIAFTSGGTARPFASSSGGVLAARTGVEPVAPHEGNEAGAALRFTNGTGNLPCEWR